MHEKSCFWRTASCVHRARVRDADDVTIQHLLMTQILFWYLTFWQRQQKLCINDIQNISFSGSVAVHFPRLQPARAHKTESKTKKQAVISRGYQGIYQLNISIINRSAPLMNWILDVRIWRNNFEVTRKWENEVLFPIAWLRSSRVKKSERHLIRGGAAACPVIQLYNRVPFVACYKNAVK